MLFMLYGLDYTPDCSLINRSGDMEAEGVKISPITPLWWTSPAIGLYQLRLYRPRWFLLQQSKDKLIWLNLRIQFVIFFWISACICNSTGSFNSICDASSGQCLCKPGVGSIQCDQCQQAYYSFSIVGKCTVEWCDSPQIQPIISGRFWSNQSEVQIWLLLNVLLFISSKRLQ